MRTKIVDVDINHLNRIEGLAGYDAVDILFRMGRDPVGRTRVHCKSDFLELEKIRPFINDLQPPPPLDTHDGPLPTVSVVICTRSRPAELAGALRSLTRQEHPADEIVVVDNGCQPEVQALVKSILPNARYLTERRPGLDFARNRALRATTGDIVAFLDDDVEADPFWVRSVAECFVAFPRASAVTGLILPLELETRAQHLFEANGGFARGFSRRILPNDGNTLFGLRVPLVAKAIGVGSGCNMAFRTEILKQLDGFDEALDTGPPLPGGGDLDIFYRVLRAGHILVYDPRALVHHRHRLSEIEIRTQIAGHQRSVTAFLVKTLICEKSWARAEITLFLSWRLTKPIYRLVLRFFGRDALPFTFLARMLVATIAGLGSYQFSKFRISREIGKT